jgi:hypothetical protein
MCICTCVLFWTVSKRESYFTVQFQNFWCTVSNISIYCSNYKVGTIYLVQYIFEKSTININALCNSCEDSIQHLWRCVTFSQHSYNVIINSHNGWRFTPIHRWEGRIILGTESKLLYSKIALSQTPFVICHIFMHTFLLRMTNTMTSQNTDLSSWDTLYNYINNY